jgi:hypothetical protein
MSPATASSESLSEVSRVVGIFAYPKRAFADIVARPRWFVPLILLAIASICLSYLYSQHVGFDRLIQQSMEQSSRAQSMTPEQRAQAVATGTKVAGVMAYVGSAIGPVIYVLVVAGILLLIFNNMLSTQITFNQMAGIVSYSFLTGLVAIALTLVIMFIKSPEDFDLRNPLSFNVGFYLNPEGTPKWLLSLATSIDLFSFWTMALMALGVTVAAHKMSWSKAFFVVMMPWVLWIAIKAAWAGMFS